MSEATVKTLNIRQRKLVLVNTDPQRRCYNGCHAKSELQWTGWAILEYDIPADKMERRLEFWRELNDYAVSQRGEGARSEFEAFPSDEPVADANRN